MVARRSLRAAPVTPSIHGGSASVSRLFLRWEQCGGDRPGWERAEGDYEERGIQRDVRDTTADSTRSRRACSIGCVLSLAAPLSSLPLYTPLLSIRPPHSSLLSRHGHSRTTILLADAHTHGFRCVERGGETERSEPAQGERTPRSLARSATVRSSAEQLCSLSRLGSPLMFFVWSGIPVARPVTTYSPNPVPRDSPGARTNYPTNSHIDSRESLSTREPDLGAYRYIESAGSLTYRAVNLPADKQRAPQRDATPDVQMEQGANGAYVPFAPKPQHPNFTTTNNVLGAERPQRFVTEEYRSGGNNRHTALAQLAERAPVCVCVVLTSTGGSRTLQLLVSLPVCFRYYPRAHTWTNQFSGGNYRSYGLSTQKDEVRVHRVEFFSTP